MCFCRAERAFDQTVLCEHSGMFFRGLMMGEREKYCVSQEWDIHEKHQRFWDEVGEIPEVLS